MYADWNMSLQKSLHCVRKGDQGCVGSESVKTGRCCRSLAEAIVAPALAAPLVAPVPKLPSLSGLASVPEDPVGTTLVTTVPAQTSAGAGRSEPHTGGSFAGSDHQDVLEIHVNPLLIRIIVKVHHCQWPPVDFDDV